MNNTSCLSEDSPLTCIMENDTANKTETNPPNSTSEGFDLSLSIQFTIFTGVAGSLANGLVLAAMLADKEIRQQTSYFLIKYHIFLDFLACLVLIVRSTLRLELVKNGGEMMKTWGLGVCMLFVGNGLLYFILYAIIPNLGIIAFERYMKVVHPLKYRNYFRRWMLYAAVAFTIFYGIVWNMPLFWTSTIGEDGECDTYAIWPSPASMQAEAIMQGIWLYVLLLVEMIYCYGRIFLKLRQQARILPTIMIPSVSPTTTNHEKAIIRSPTKPANQEEGTSQCQTRQDRLDEVGTSRYPTGPSNQEKGINKHQINVIKNMIAISVTYAVTTFLDNFGFIVWSFDSNTWLESDKLYFIDTTLYFLNVWFDIFIYVVGNKEIRKSFMRHLSCLRANNG